MKLKRGDALMNEEEEEKEKGEGERRYLQAG
jgi:hypothetical protein